MTSCLYALDVNSKNHTVSSASRMRLVFYEPDNKTDIQYIKVTQLEKTVQADEACSTASALFSA